MIDAIFQHRSIRKYLSNEIPAPVLEKVLLAGTRASTTGNMQVYSIISTTKQELKDQLWEAHFRQAMVKQAPVILTFCADFHRFNQWCLQRNAKPGYDNFLSFFTGAIDALLASQNIALEAVNQGLGICYLGTTTYNAKKIIEILEIPPAVIPVTTLVVGYPDENPPLTDRLPLEAILHHEKYQKPSPADINRFYYEKEKSMLTQELLKINKKDTLAQIFTDLRYKHQDNVAFSIALLDVIRQQGFMNQESI
jgi:nitroreductase